MSDKSIVNIEDAAKTNQENKKCSCPWIKPCDFCRNGICHYNSSDHPDAIMTDPCMLPDGSGFSRISMPLPKNHWLLRDEDNVSPAPFRMGVNHPCRKGFEEALRSAGKYACRCATMNGTQMDFDPDALIQNLIIGFLGYYTDDGLEA